MNEWKNENKNLIAAYKKAETELSEFLEKQFLLNNQY